MKKNHILRTAGLMMAAGFICSIIIVSACKESAKPKEIGIQLWSVRDDMRSDPATTIKKLGETGYSYVEAAGYNNGKFYGMEPLEFKALLEANGMTMKGSHTGIDLPKDADWEQAMAWWDQCIAAHKAAGAEWIVKPSMGSVAYRSLDTLKMFCDYYNIVGEKCNNANIRFGYHNHAGEFETELEGITVYDFMIENTDPVKVMFQLDLYWIMKGGKNAVDYFNKYPGRFELYHVKDVEELGASGTMDFKTAFDMAGQAGMKHYIVEVEQYNFEPIESVRRSLEFLNAAEYTK